MIEVDIIEHKTTTEDIGEGSPYWARLILDSQLSNYFVGTRALGFEPRSVLYDVAKRPTQRPYTATPLEEREYKKPKDRACKECKKKNPAPMPHVEIVGEGADAREVHCVDGRIVTDPGGQLYANMREFDETPEEFRARLREDIGNNPDKYFRRGRVVRLDKEERAAAKDTWNVARWIREVQLEARDEQEQAWPRNVDACQAYNSTCDYWPVCTGQADLNDPTRFRRVQEVHEELGEKKRRLPLVSTSSMKTFRSCPRKYYFRYELGFRVLIVSEALRFGTLFHKGLEIWWQSVDIVKALEAIRAHGRASDAFELVRAEELMLGYHVRWAEEPLDVLAVEAEFVAPVVNPQTKAPSKTWELGGKIDAIVKARPVQGVRAA